MNSGRVKSTTIIDLFFDYPYKKNIACGDNSVPIPYVKKDDIVYHDFTLDYNMWRDVIEEYLKQVSNCLSSAESFKLPGRLGFLEVKKFKSNRFFDRIKSKEQNKQVFLKKNGHDNYMFFIEWSRRYKEACFSFKWHWRFKPNRKLLRELYEQAEQDYTFINKFKTGK